jgi:hypothetical protein
MAIYDSKYDLFAAALSMWAAVGEKKAPKFRPAKFHTHSAPRQKKSGQMPL